MDLSCAKVDIATYAALLRKCSDLGRGKQIHAEIVTNGLSYSTFLNNLLVQMYGRCGNPQQAKQVFDNIDERNTYSWTLMTLAYTQNGCAREAVELYKQMESQQDIQPDAFTFSGVLGAFLDPRDFEQGKKVHEDILRNGWDSDLVLATGLIGMYSRCGSLELARSVFDKMEDRDHVAWTTMVVAYVRNGHPQQCLKLFEEMKDSAVFPSVFTFTAVLVACGNLGDLQQGRKIHREMPRRCLESTEVQNALVDMYAKCGSLEEARGVFENMDNRDIVSWSSMISAYSRHEQYASKAVELYRKMDLEGVKPDGFVFSSVLSAFSSLGDLQQGRCVHDRLLACGEKLDVVIAAALVKLYASGKFLGNARKETTRKPWFCTTECCHRVMSRTLPSMLAHWELVATWHRASRFFLEWCSGLEAARRKFDSSVAFKRNQFAASMIIAEYVKAEQPEKALAVYRDMELRPDAITYASIVSACTALGATAEGKLVHDRIIADGLDNTDVVLQNAVLNMYIKCGRLEEAELIFRGMFSRNVVSWTALITAYAQSGFPTRSLQLFNDMNLDHLGLVDKGHEYFVSMRRDYGVQPLVEHYVGMVDVLARAGWLGEARELVEHMPYQPTEVAWTTVLSSNRLL